MPDMESYNMEEWHRFLFHDSKVAWDIDHGRYSRSRKQSTKPLEFSCLCSFTHGSSIVLNEALIIADQYNLIPFTDSLLHHQLLDVKYESTRKVLATGKTSRLSGAAPLDPLKLRRVALTLFD